MTSLDGVLILRCFRMQRGYDVLLSSCSSPSRYPALQMVGWHVPPSLGRGGRSSITESWSVHNFLCKQNSQEAYPSAFHPSHKQATRIHPRINVSLDQVVCLLMLAAGARNWVCRCSRHAWVVVVCCSFFTSFFAAQLPKLNYILILS